MHSIVHPQHNASYDRMSTVLRRATVLYVFHTVQYSMFTVQYSRQRKDWEARNGLYTGKVSVQ